MTGETSFEPGTEWLHQKWNCKAGGEEVILLYAEEGKVKTGL